MEAWVCKKQGQGLRGGGYEGGRGGVSGSSYHAGEHGQLKK